MTKKVKAQMMRFISRNRRSHNFYWRLKKKWRIIGKFCKKFTNLRERMQRKWQHSKKWTMLVSNSM